MYIQITTKCNMTCDHCAFSCTNKGKHMSLAIFRKACDFASNFDDNIFLGGGEPTLHPQFEHFLGIALLNSNSESNLGLVTNGTNEKLTLQLLRLAQEEKIFCEVSLDNWHDYDMVSDQVRDLATRQKMVSRIDKPMKRGRATYGINRCACADMLISPEGDVYPCGCKIKKIGNILDPHFNPCCFYNNHECELEMEEAQ